MPVRKAIPRGATVSASFRAHADNSGASLIGSGWVGAPDTETRASCIHCGESSTHAHRESGARWLSIDLNVPDDGGSIQVRVSANGRLIDEGTARRDEVWTYPVLDA